MKIAFFVAEFPVLSETFVIRQVAGMVKAGHDVTVIAGQWGDQGIRHKIYEDARLATIVLPVRTDDGGIWPRLARIAAFAARAPFSALGRRSLAVAVRALLAGSAASLLDLASLDGRRSLGSYDAIIAHFGPAGVRAMHLQEAGLLQGPLATVFHGFDVSDRKTLRRLHGAYQALFEHCARLLPISNLWCETLASWGASPVKLEVLRMGIDTDRLSLGDPARPMNRPLRILSVARFTEKKGLRYAIAGACKAARPLDYEIIGDGPLANELRQLAADLPGGKRIAFLGRKPQEQVFQALERADVFLLPSVTAADGDMEGVPVALMEAMAKGIIVVATRHSGIPELVADGESGFLVEERNAGQIAQAIDNLPDDTAELSRLRLCARATVELEFDNSRLDRQLESLVAEMAAERAAGPAWPMPSGLVDARAP